MKNFIPLVSSNAEMSFVVFSLNIYIRRSLRCLHDYSVLPLFINIDYSVRFSVRIRVQFSVYVSVALTGLGPSSIVAASLYNTIRAAGGVVVAPMGQADDGHVGGEEVGGAGVTGEFKEEHSTLLKKVGETEEEEGGRKEDEGGGRGRRRVIHV